MIYLFHSYLVENAILNTFINYGFTTSYYIFKCGNLLSTKPSIKLITIILAIPLNTYGLKIEK